MGRIEKSFIIKMPKISEDKLVNIALAILTGLLYAFLFPDFNLEFLAWFFLLPLLYAVNRANNFKESFLYGFISGVTAYVVILYWIAYTVRVYGNLPFYEAVFALLLLSSYLAVYIGLFAGFGKILLNNYKKFGIIYEDYNER